MYHPNSGRRVPNYRVVDRTLDGQFTGTVCQYVGYRPTLLTLCSAKESATSNMKLVYWYRLLHGGLLHSV